MYYYGYNQIPLTDWKDLRVYFSILIHLLMLGLAWVFFQSQRILSFALLFYLLAIAPFSHFFVALPDTMADRFMFTPSLGLCILTVAALNALLGTPLWQQVSKKKQTTRS